MRTIDDDVFEQANQMFETTLNNYLSKKDLIYTFERAPQKISIDILLSVIDSKLVDCEVQPLTVFRNIISEMFGMSQ